MYACKGGMQIGSKYVGMYVGMYGSMDLWMYACMNMQMYNHKDLVAAWKNGSMDERVYVGR